MKNRCYITPLVICFLCVPSESIRIAEAIALPANGFGQIYNTATFVSGTKDVTILAWVGVSKFSYCFMGVVSVSEQLEFCLQITPSATSIVINSLSGSTSVSGAQLATQDNKLWFRLAVSFKFETKSLLGHFFIESLYTTFANKFAKGESADIILGMSKVSSPKVLYATNFFSLSVFAFLVDGKSLAYVTTDLFQLAPVPKLIAQLSKRPNYSESFLNLIIEENDVDNRGYQLLTSFNNAYNSFEALENGILLPYIANVKANIDQSYLVWMRLELFYRGEITQGIFSQLESRLYTRTTSSDIIVFKNCLILRYNPGTSTITPYAEATMRLADSQNTYDAQSVKLAKSTNQRLELGLKYQIIKVRKTLYDNLPTVYLRSFYFDPWQKTASLNLSTTDQHFIGDTRFSALTTFDLSYPMITLIIYEVGFFLNSYIDNTTINKVIAGFDEDSLSLMCNINKNKQVERSSYLTPTSLLYNSCTEIDIVATCNIVGCKICENSICYFCKIGYVLNRTNNTCTKCGTTGKLWDPRIKRCLSLISNISVTSNLITVKQVSIDSSQYSNSITVDGTNNYINSVNLKSTTLKLLFSKITVDDVYKLTISDKLGTSTVQMLQFYDPTIFDDDNYVYVSIPSIYNLNDVTIEGSSSFTMTGSISFSSVWVSSFVDLDPSFDCLQTTSPYTYINNISSINCVEACPIGYYPTSSKKCATCPTPCTICGGFNSCFACPPGFVQSGSDCLKCGSNCVKCVNTTNNCTACVIGYEVVAVGTNNLCQMITTPPADESFPFDVLIEHIPPPEVVAVIIEEANLV